MADVADDFEPDEHEEDLKDILKACILQHGGILHPKWVLPDETEYEEVVVKLKEYVGLQDIKLLDIEKLTPKPIPTTPNAKERIVLSLDNAMKVANISFKTGYTYTSDKDPWNVETRERTKMDFMKAVNLQQELMQETDVLRQALAEAREECEHLRTDNNGLRKANRDLEKMLQSRISMMNQQQDELKRITEHNRDMVGAIVDISKSLQSLNLSK